MIMSLIQLWNKPETNFVLFQFYFSFISHVRAALALAKSGRLELEDNVIRHYMSIFNHYHIIRPQTIEFGEKNAK